MAQTTMLDIVTLCLAIEQKAAEIYGHFSTSSQEDELKDFWQRMANEELFHSTFWQSLVDMARQDMLPCVFENIDQTQQELRDVRGKVENLWKRFDESPSTSNKFLLALRLEFILLHPAFQILFHYMKTVSGQKNPEDTYDSHLKSFMDSLQQYGEVTPELELISETLQGLWRKNMELASQSVSDELTGVLNRRGFFNASKPLVHLAHRNGSQLGILMADIDNFKIINDTHGHQLGDQVLRNVASLMSDGIRRSDLIGRYGGEEFIILFSALDQEAMFSLAEKIRRKIEKETTDQVHATISIGIAVDTIGDDGEQELLGLIRRADECLYKAKNSGKNKVVAYDD